MALMDMKDYRKLLKDEPLESLEHERVKNLSFIFRYEHSNHEKDPSDYAEYVNAKKRLNLLNEEIVKRSLISGICMIH